MTAPTLDELEAKAKAATPGPWRWDADHEPLDGPGQGGYGSDHVLFAAPCGTQNSYVVVDDPDARHIAANSPDVTLALVARIRALEAGLREACDLHDAAVESYNPEADVRVTELRALVEAKP